MAGFFSVKYDFYVFTEYVDSNLCYRLAVTNLE